MSQAVSDDLLGRITIEPVPMPHGTRTIGRVTGPPELVALTTALDFFNWRRLPLVAEAVRDRQGINIDDIGFRYPGEDLDPGEEPFEEVEVFGPLGSVFVSVSGFERLMARYFRTLQTGAEAARDPVIEEPWWTRFVEMTEEIERRASFDT